LFQIFSSAPCSQTPSLPVRSEVITAVTMKNAVFWDKNPVRTSQETLCLSYRAQPVNAV
jgi:hypothetical protein